jgi:hypothetical protein
VIHNDAMVIEVNIAGWIIGKVLVDNGSSADILFLKTFEKNEPEPAHVAPARIPVARFQRKTNQASWKDIASYILRRS